MNVIKKIFEMIERIFGKKDDVKLLEEKKQPMQEPIQQNKRQIYTDSLKVERKPVKKEKKIEILTCLDAGLGIQKKISA